ncbi:hypothetical protein CDD80_7435 [Ophiocordyceps camponoti-rufipedis]|uniref:NADH dehydrogenase [ubiquinone] 1 beta subcomplex subunit 9 n=1 Tax=Ophiocordyceps camponoti-rufipedis TaxID=2004952 RepID=A0A2C5YGB2_9HYPO|nr:hypothetical protein CDD80_7435 [Ophiocordyceps camponoti-rufipedis]
MSTRREALSLYRRALKLTLDWAVQRQIWRGQALYIRSLFEANRNISDPRQQKALLVETEKLLDSWKHPDPYIPPTAPGGELKLRGAYKAKLIPADIFSGSKYERNLPSPALNREEGLNFALTYLLTPVHSAQHAQ